MEAGPMTMILPDRTPKRLDEWSEDDGPVLWWKFPLDEAPYCGTPNDLGHIVEMHHYHRGEMKVTRTTVGGWPGYHTHWTRFEMPIEQLKR
jgi:hypothetical protein